MDGTLCSHRASTHAFRSWIHRQYFLDTFFSSTHSKNNDLLTSQSPNKQSLFLTYRKYTATRSAVSQVMQKSPFRVTFLFWTQFWRLATFPLRVSLLLPRLTAVFGMGTGVTTASNHQNRIQNGYGAHLNLHHNTNTESVFDSFMVFTLPHGRSDN